MQDEDVVIDTVYSPRDEAYVPLSMFRFCNPAARVPRNFEEKEYLDVQEQGDVRKLPYRGYILQKVV